MRKQWQIKSVGLLVVIGAVCGVITAGETGTKTEKLKAQLGGYKCRIVYESCPEGNFELFTMNTDGTEQHNLTNTPDVDEFYPHASPDGKRISFTAIEKNKEPKVRSVYVMDVGGGIRTKIADNAREACWSPDGKTIAYLQKLPDDSREGLFFCELETGKKWEHPNKTINGLYNICWAPNNKWILSTVASAMGFSGAIIAIELDGPRIVELIHETPPIYECRPDLSPDGKKVAWVGEDFWQKWWIEVSDINLEQSEPKPVNSHHVVYSPGKETYHPDWSPEGRYIAFSRGPKASRMAGSGQGVETVAEGWDICVVDTQDPNNFVVLTSNGKSNKEPDWVLVPNDPEPDVSKLKNQMKSYKHKIVYQSYPKDNSEIFIANADGSGQTNLTNTPDVDEFYPHASPDGRSVSFMAIEKNKEQKLRSVYIMNIDGSGRRKIADNARQACWSPDGKKLAYLQWLGDGSREGLFFCDLATGEKWEHPNKGINGLWNICWAPNDRWVLTSVAGALGFGHAIVALEMNGTGVVELRHSTHPIYQCRPDLSPDGKKVAWVKENFWTTWWIEVADIDLNQANPQPMNLRPVVTSSGKESYHPDWSPEGRFIAFSLGPKASRMVGSGQEVETVAAGWDICVVDTENPGVFIKLTENGTSNKEPDWVFVK